jgi:hypothetical protein
LQVLTLPNAVASALQFIEKYLAAAAGPAKWSQLVQFLQDTYPRITAELVSRQQNQVGS